MNDPIELKEMKKILEEQFKVLWGYAFGIVDEEIQIKNLRIKKDNKKEIENLKKLIFQMEQQVKEYRDEFHRFFNIDFIEAIEQDLSAFKNEIFAKKLWTVKSALYDHSNPELERYRDSFDNATPRDIYEHVRRILNTSKNYVENVFPNINLKTILNINSMKLDFINDKEMLMTGVIGLGIRSEMLHRLYPGVFPIMTRRSLWGMYFLTEQDEFVVDENRDGKSRTSHQWNYEYDRFCFYCNFLMNIMENYLSKYKINIKPEIRFGYINLLLVEFADKFKDKINELYSWKYTGLR
jgi:hypothetical protein